MVLLFGPPRFFAMLVVLAVGRAVSVQSDDEDLDNDWTNQEYHFAVHFRSIDGAVLQPLAQPSLRLANRFFEVTFTAVQS